MAKERRQKRRLIVLAASVSAVVVLATGGAATAAFPGANGKIAFTGSDGDAEIFTVNPDGSDVAQLTTNGAGDAQAAWSPDGEKIAFASARDGDAEIYVMEADGSDQRRLTASSGADAYPAWSPDGTKITFASNRDGDFEIFVMDQDGSNQTQLTRNTVAEFGSDWSPDGTKIAFHRGRDDGGVGIVVINVDGSGQVDLSPASSANDFDPSWSPDGTKIAFWAAGGGIFTMNADGSGRTQLTNQGDLEPAWSPDGGKIAFVRPRTGGADLFTMNADGSGQVLVSSVGGAQLLRPDWQPVVTQTVFADLAVTHEASAKKANTKKPFTYTISVENLGPGPAAGVVVSDFLDDNELFSSVSSTRGTCTTPAAGSSRTVVCNVGALDVAARVEVVVVVELPPKNTFGTKKPEISNTASVGGTTVDAVAANNTATLVTAVVGP